MSEEVKGEIGKSGAKYDIQVDDKLNISLGLSDSFEKSEVVSGGILDGVSISMKGSAEIKAGVPLEKILDAAAAATKNGIVIAGEGWLKTFLESYEAAKPKPA